MAALEISEDLSSLRRRCRAVDGLDFDVGCPESTDLVVHQSQQRRDDNRNAHIDDGGELEAKTLSEPGSSL